jgi:hypothetical protein
MSRLGWAPREYRFAVPSVGDCESFHFELSPPEGLFITEIGLDARDSTGHKIDKSKIRISTNANLGHVYISGLPPGGTKGTVVVSLRAPTRGLLHTGLLVSLVTFLLLGLGAKYHVYLGPVFEQLDAAAALLLAVPAVAITLLFRPREHVLAAQVLSGVRVAVLLSALLLYVAAITMVVEIAPVVRNVAWWTLTGGALISLLVVGIAWGGSKVDERRREAL